MLVLEKGLAVIECFDGRQSLSVSEAAALTGLSRAAARRCLLTLVTLGYATSEGPLFRLAPRILRLGSSYLTGAELPQIVQPELDRISAALHESCSASVLDGVDVLYIARAATTRIISTDLRAGSRLPAYCNAMGRVLLASLSPDEAETLLRGSDRPQRTARTLTQVPELLAELDVVRRQDFAIVEGELEAGLITVAVPVRNAEGRTIAGVNIAAHTNRVDREMLITSALPHLRQLQASLRPLLRR
ncbi:MAG: helix-turn-helix domain-containing protein [Parafilimonas terrae]|nr:helix-turn-helix domain-containing protein [Parafilimonas terrae]